MHSYLLAPLSLSLGSLRIFLILASLVLHLTVKSNASAQTECPCGSIRITTYPNVEPFENQNLCGLDGAQCSQSCPLATTGQWQNQSNDSLDWTVNSGGTPTDRTGPSKDATLGTPSGRYAYLESSCPDIGYPEREALLYGKRCFNFQSLIAPEMTYSYHMYGEEMGEVRVEVSTDQCATWQTADVLSGQQQTSSSSSWKSRVVNLLPWAGRSNVRIRIRGTTGGDQFSDLAIDDIKVGEASCCDVAVTKITAPGNKCGMGSAEAITIELRNYGYTPQTGFPVSYRVDGGTTVTEVFNGSVAPGGIASFTFATPANLSTIGEHVIEAFSSLPGDTRNENNNSTRSVVSVPTISSFPYLQSFENGKGGWTSDGFQSSWAFGNPQKEIIAGAASGLNAWVTGGLDESKYPNTESSSVISPCFNLSSLRLPVVRLKSWWNSEGGYDGAALQSSINSGGTWQTVGTVGEGLNWYTSGNIISNPGGQSAGWSGSNSDAVSAGSNGWVQSAAVLTGLGGQSSTRLRIAFGSDPAVRDDGFGFDDFEILEGFTANKSAILFLDANGNGRADPNDQIKYSIVLTNTSPRSLTGMIFNDIPNPNTQLVVGSVTTTAGTIQRGNTSGNTDVQVGVGGLAATGSATISFRVSVRPPTSSSTGQICSQGTVIANGLVSTQTDDPSVNGSFNPTCVAAYPDTDGDGVIDYLDRCQGFPDSLDADLDTVPDGCDQCPGSSDLIDSDGDGVPNGCDGCPTDASKTTPGICGCGIPDIDSDSDGVPNCNDQCPSDPLKSQPGICGCGIADSDGDSDGTPNCQDGCPNDPLKTTPGVCGCGLSETDTDFDTTPDCIDQCPNDPNKINPGACGCGNLDTDSDGDSTPNCQDQCPNDPGKVAPGICGCGISDQDLNGNGTADCLDSCSNGSNGDADNDGIPDCNDQCPTDPNKSTPGICGCGVPETDSDADGSPNCIDLCPNDPLKTAPGVCGCSISDQDSDGDGTPNCNDLCPIDPTKTSPGFCGCGAAETDSDQDGTPNCADQCPQSPIKTTPGLCGCDVPDTDSDSDGAPNCQDLCVNDPAKQSPGICGCGIADTDSDSDGKPNCIDQCPNDPLKSSPGMCGCGVPDNDLDADGVLDCQDGCPTDPTKTSPGACGCGTPDLDSDMDGSPNCVDGCPADPDKNSPGGCGCGQPETDGDGDQIPDCVDTCPSDPNKSEAGICGCGVPDLDSDQDGSVDCEDRCPFDAGKITPGICGCGIPDTNSDGDAVADCQDGCPNDSSKLAPGLCGCGEPDNDSDGDGVLDCNDGCLQDPTKILPGMCGCGIKETDTDNDGKPDCVDQCPTDPAKFIQAECGCGVPETDKNTNGVPDCNIKGDIHRELSTLQSQVKTLKVYKGSRGPQVTLRKVIKSRLSALKRLVSAKGRLVVLAQRSRPIKSLMKGVDGSVSRVIVIKDRSGLKLYKRTTDRQIRAFQKALE